MKTLYIVRHAKAEQGGFDTKDFDRKLNERGEDDAKKMGKRLANMKVKPDSLVSSPAKRALSTARIIAKQLDIDKNTIVEEHSIYEANTATLLLLIKKTNDKVSSLMIFGHNPGFTDLAQELCAEAPDAMPTAGIVAISFESDSWKKVETRKGKLVFFEWPKK